jgi:hypothetical protein
VGDFDNWSLQQLAGQCRKVSARHPDPVVREKADKLFNQYLLLVTQASLPEELEESRELLRLKIAEFVDSSSGSLTN